MERERKFLVTHPPKNLQRHPHVRIHQGYLTRGSQEAQVRLRRIGNRRIMTIKKGNGRVRTEIEFPLTAAEFRKLWPLTRGARLIKTRFYLRHGPRTIEVDRYEGRHRGLIVAEVEFSTTRAMHAFRPPSWMQRDISDVRKYSNVHLAYNP